MKAAHVMYVGSFVGLLALGLVSIARSATGDGWRWPRYDNRAVKVRVVTDDRGLLPALRTAARAWEATGDLHLDVDRKTVAKCEQREVTICVTAGADQAILNWGGSWLYPLIRNGAQVFAKDGLALLGYAKVWVNTAHVHTADEQADILCHELGHAIGLDHPVEPYQKPTCMAAEGVSPLPSSEDLTFLHNLYAVRDTR